MTLSLVLWRFLGFSVFFQLMFFNPSPLPVLFVEEKRNITDYEAQKKKGKMERTRVRNFTQDCRFTMNHSFFLFRLKNGKKSKKK
jgi:hypothetical protein